MSRSGPVTKDTTAVALGLAQIRVGRSAANIAQIAPVLTAAESIGAMASTKFTSNIDYWKLESGFPLNEDLSIPIRETAMLECEFKEITTNNLAIARGIDPSAAVSASVSNGVINSTAGTVDSTKVISPDALGTVTETVIIVFTGAEAGTAYGSISGEIGSFTDLSAAFEPANGINDYFSIPADFFTGTWADGDTYTFTTSVAIAAGAGAFADNHTGSIGLGAMTSPAFVRMEAVYTYPNGTNTMTIIFPRANAVSSVEIDWQAEDNSNVPLTFEAKRSDDEVDGGNAVWNTFSLGRIVFA